jgi:hypothetical protein
MPLEAGPLEAGNPVEVVINLRNDLMSTSSRQAYREELREKLPDVVGLLSYLVEHRQQQQNDNSDAGDGAEQRRRGRRQDHEHEQRRPSDGVFMDFVGSPRSRFDAPISQ